jgi:hypothetical protein
MLAEKLGFFHYSIWVLPLTCYYLILERLKYTPLTAELLAMDTSVNFVFWGVGIDIVRGCR